MKEILAVVLKKKPLNQSLTSAHKERSADIVTDWTIFTYCFERLIELWGVYSKQHWWSEEEYDDPFSACPYPTNVCVSFHQVRDHDTDMSSVARKNVCAVGVLTSERRRTTEIRYIDSSFERLCSYMHRSAQSSKENSKVISENLLGKIRFKIFEGPGVTDSEGGGEKESDSLSAH